MLYVDGEMPHCLMKERVKSLMPKDMSFPRKDSLRFLCANSQPLEVNFPNLSTLDGQKALMPRLEGVDLLILDSVVTLMSGIDENDAKSWAPIQEWFLFLRKRGISILIAHHDNRGGTQRGTSAKEDILDSVIHLRKLSTNEKATVTMTFTKSRGFLPSEQDAPTIQLVDLQDGKRTWKLYESDDDRKKNSLCD